MPFRVLFEKDNFWSSIYYSLNFKMQKTLSLPTGFTTSTISAYTWPRLLSPRHMIGPLSIFSVSFIIRSFPVITWRLIGKGLNALVHLITGGGYPKILHDIVVSQVSYPTWYTSGDSTKRGGTAKLFKLCKWNEQRGFWERTFSSCPS